MFESAQLLNLLIRVAIRLAGAGLILIATRNLARAGRRRLQPILKRANMTPSLITLATTVTFYGIWLVGVMAALVILGVPVDTVLLVAVGVLLVLGIALQESLRDLAATVNFIMFGHFEVGDLIETNGILGTVREIELLNTSLLCADRKVAVLPNGKIQQEGLLNYSKEGILRVDLVFTISYEDDLPRAKEVIKQLLSEDARDTRRPRAHDHGARTGRQRRRYRCASLREVRGLLAGRMGPDRGHEAALRPAGHHHPVPAAGCAREAGTRRQVAPDPPLLPPHGCRI